MLKGDKVILRPMRREYLEKYFEYRNDVELQILAGAEPPMPMEYERLDALFDRAVEQVVAALHEVDRLRAHDLFDLGMAPAFRGADAHVAQTAGSLHLEQLRQMLLPGQQVVHLHQVEAPHAPVGARGLDLRRAARAVADPHLLGREQICASAWPMVGCDEPYIGDESIIRPPAAKKARTTSTQASRAAASLPTLKVIQLPRPTTGSASPLEGMRRIIGVAATPGGNRLASAPPSSARRLKDESR